jgi:Predicted signal transduction protein with a C-terminal ATPase domain
MKVGIITRIVSKFNDISLKYKLVILYGSLIAFSISLVGWFSNYNMTRYVYKQTSESFGQTLDQVKMNVEFKMQTYDKLLSQIISDQSLINVLSNEYTMESDFVYDYLKTVRKAFDLKETDDNIIDIMIYKNNKSLPEDGHNLFDIERVKDKSWFVKSFKNFNNYGINELRKISKDKLWFVTDEKLLKDYGNKTVEKPVFKVMIVKPIIVKFEKLIGFIQVYVRQDSIFSELSGSGDQGAKHIYIADENGEIMFDNVDPRSQGKHIVEGLMMQTGGKSEGRFVFGSNGKSKLVLFDKGADSKWIYFMELPMADLLSGANKIRDFTVLVILLGTFFSFIIGITIASMLSKRVTTLSRIMERVEDLNLNLCKNIEGNDEMGKLAKSYNVMLLKIGRLVEEIKTSHQKQKDTEILALQAQINPHFLYNTLATIYWMALDNNTKKITSMVRDLSTFYRLALNKGKEYIEIKDEISQVMAYVNIQKVRLEDKINVYYSISDDIKGFYTPKLIIQPFVENAILHGAEYKNGVTNIIIKVTGMEDRILFEIIDDGVGMRNVPDPAKYQYSSGYGIYNVHEKITIRFGCGYGVRISSLPGAGTNAGISIPVIETPPDN